MIKVFLSVLPIFLLISIGFLSKRLIRDSESFWRISDKFVYYLFFPSLLILDISSASFSAEETARPIIATLLATATVALIIFITKPLTTHDNKLFTSVFQGGIRYNSYVFIALSQSLFGSEGVALSGVFVAYMIITTNIMSVLVLNKYGDKDKQNINGVIGSLVKNPLILGAVIGSSINALDLQISSAVLQLMTYLGGAATPLSLMSVGAGLILSMNVNRAAATGYAVALKLFVMPAITFALLASLGVTGTIAGVALLYASVPATGNAYILARQMGGDTESMASIITWTTLISILSITLIIGLTPIVQPHPV